MERVLIGLCVVLLGLASFAQGQEPPDSSKAEKLLNEYAELVVGGTWTGTVKTGDFVDGNGSLMERRSSSIVSIAGWVTISSCT